MRKIIIYYCWFILVFMWYLMISTINIVVNKLWKFHGKIIDNTIIQKIISTIHEEAFSDAKIYKITHTLKNKWYLISIKKNCFLCINPNKPIDEEEIVQTHYRSLLKKHCQTFIQWWWYIGGLKALELHLQNYEIPENIDIINTHKNALEVIMFNKTVAYKRYTHQKVDIFTKIKKYLISRKIGKYTFPVASVELAILESLHNPSKLQDGLITEYIKRIIRKYKKTLNLDFFGMILNNNKHHVGINRFYQIAKSVDAVFADKLHIIIKKHSFLIQNGK